LSVIKYYLKPADKIC